MSNKELIERLNKPCGRTTGHGESCSVGWLCGACADKAKAADALELADKRIAELEARCRWHEEGSASIVGYPWDTPFQDGLKTGRHELLDELDEAERKLAVAREALRYAYEEAKGWYDESRGDVLVLPLVEEALAQIGGEDA